MSLSFCRGLWIFGLACFSFLFLPFTSSLFAQREITYDPYSSALKYPEPKLIKMAKDREQNQLWARFLEHPFRPVGYGIGRTAQWVEEHHMDEKVVWFFDELSTHGIFPKWKTPSEGSFGTVGLQGRIDPEKLLQMEHPSISAAGFGGWTPNKFFVGTTVEAGGEYKIEPPESLIFHEGEARFTRSSSESFYGVGQATSLGDQTSYQPEELKLVASFGTHLMERTDGRASFVYQKVKIGNGNRERVGKLKEYFLPSQVPGIHGGRLIGFETELSHDSRDHAKDPKRGGQGKIEFSYFHDVDGSDLHYLKVGGSITHYVPIFSDRRVLALRLVAEKNQELGGGDIPFFNLSRLGGTDRRRGSELLRSYRYNRFFEEGLILGNSEYRYNIYEYGDFAIDAFVLFDVGEVFGELGDFKFDELDFSYGGGFNIKFRRRTLFSFVLARGNEGWNSSVDSTLSF